MIYDLEEINQAVHYLLNNHNNLKVWCFVGEMGAGKTTMIKAICQELGVVDLLSSPTFSIVNVYQTLRADEVYHFDFYRIEDDREVLQLGVEEYFDSGNLCMVEWPDRVINFLPDEYLKISIKLVSENRRELIVANV